MTIAVYMRVSDEDQSHDSQRHDLERWLKGQGHDPKAVAWFIDQESGEHMDRPAMEKLRKATFAGEIKTVVIWKLDRLARDLQAGMNVLCDWINDGVRVVVVTLGLDLTGSIGKIVATVLLGFAEIDLQNLRDRQAAGIAVAKANGVYKGREKGTLKANPARARELKAAGLKPAEIMKTLGIKSRTTLSKYLNAAD